MLEAEGKFMKQSGGRGQFARVFVSIIPDSEVLAIDFVNDNDWGSVNYKVPADWKRGATAGIEFGLDRCGRPGGIVTAKIHGTYADTNPTVVGIAAAYAIFQAFGYQVSPNVVRKLEEMAFTSDHEAIPDFTLIPICDSNANGDTADAHH